MPKRRDVIRGLLSAVPGLAIGPALPAMATSKSPTCAPCSGNGNCISGACRNHLCAPQERVCGNPKRPLYKCSQRNRPQCCKPGGHGCKGWFKG